MHVGAEKEAADTCALVSNSSPYTALHDTSQVSVYPRALHLSPHSDQGRQQEQHLPRHATPLLDNQQHWRAPRHVLSEDAGVSDTCHPRGSSSWSPPGAHAEKRNGRHKDDGSSGGLLASSLLHSSLAALQASQMRMPTEQQLGRMQHLQHLSHLPSSPEKRTYPQTPQKMHSSPGMLQEKLASLPEQSFTRECPAAAPSLRGSLEQEARNASTHTLIHDSRPSGVSDASADGDVSTRASAAAAVARNEEGGSERLRESREGGRQVGSPLDRWPESPVMAVALSPHTPISLQRLAPQTARLAALAGSEGRQGHSLAAARGSGGKEEAVEEDSEDALPDLVSGTRFGYVSACGRCSSGLDAAAHVDAAAPLAQPCMSEAWDGSSVVCHVSGAKFGSDEKESGGRSKAGGVGGGAVIEQDIGSVSQIIAAFQTSSNSPAAGPPPAFALPSARSFPPQTLPSTAVESATLSSHVAASVSPMHAAMEHAAMEEEASAASREPHGVKQGEGKKEAKSSSAKKSKKAKATSGDGFEGAGGDASVGVAIAAAGAGGSHGGDVASSADDRKGRERGKAPKSKHVQAPGQGQAPISLFMYDLSEPAAGEREARHHVREGQVDGGGDASGRAEGGGGAEGSGRAERGSGAEVSGVGGDAAVASPPSAARQLLMQGSEQQGGVGGVKFPVSQ